MSGAVDPVLMQKLLDTYRREVEAADQEQEHQRERQLHDMQAKLAARKERRLREEQRKTEEAAARQFVEEQERQMRGAVAHREEDDTFKAPGVLITGELTVEEQALRKEQVPMQRIHNYLGCYHYFFQK